MHAIKEAYRKKVASGALQRDPIQEALVEKLDLLRSQLETRKLAAKSSALGWLFVKKNNSPPLKGLYIWGSVGRGKSMLMDLFFAASNVTRKRRVHFHDFMADAQERIQRQRDAFKAGKSKEEDPIPPVAREIAEEARLLCFDEFTVTDIADAMILGRLFKGLFEAGTIVVATSNVAPENLYLDGLNRQRFLPFIDMLFQHCEVFELDAKTDYRLEKLSSAPVYNAPLNKRSEEAMDRLWEAFTEGRTPKPDVVLQKGRKIAVPAAIEGVARFSFADLCEKPLAAADYLAITRQFHTIFVDHVPILSKERRNEAKRFILLIDALYDRKIRLVISAEANPHALYAATKGTEAFEFQRTASRLIEMQSTEYLAGIDALKERK